MSFKPEDKATYERAQRTVLGVQAAKANGSTNDVNFLIECYMREEMELGRTNASAWALLFSASVNWIDALFDQDAVHHRTTKAKRINQWSMEHARSLS